MVDKVNLTQTIKDGFTRYAGTVILDRAICDVRDMLKPAARMLIYSQLKATKNTYNKPFVKSARVVGDCLGNFYTHGEASCYGTYCRMAKPFAMRYPLEESQGNMGTIITTGDEAASRYTELRLSKTASYIYDGLEKDTIEKWSPNFDDTAFFPTVMPSIGFYNIVNGTTGIGVSLSSSVPQFNIREVNNSIIKLIQNPESSDEEIICLPDFATGATLLNRDEVIESLKQGKGKACRLRATMIYQPSTNSIEVTEMPYGVYTSTVTEQIKELVDEDENYGVEKIDDTSGLVPHYSIILSKGVNPQKMIKKLCKDTSLESYFTINMVMLREGRYPEVFSFRRALEEYITHASSCFRKEYEYDLNILKAREEILNGLLLAIANIDEVVSIIRSSSSSSDATTKLIARFSFTQNQVKAILDMKLQRLIRLEGIKIEDELKSNQKSQNSINEILTSKEKFNSELIKVFQKVADEFGDARRTKVVNEVEEVEEESIQEIPLYIYQLSTGELAVRAKSVSRFPKADILTQYETTNFGSLYYFTKDGKCGKISLQDKEVGKNYPIDKDVVAIMEPDTITSSHYLVFFTKKGMVKKSLTSEYNMHSKKTTAIKLKDNDEVVSVVLTGDESVLDYRIISKKRILRFSADCVSSTGRATMGVKGISLKDDDEVISGEAILKNELLDCACSIRAGAGTRR